MNETADSTLADWERAEIDRANASDLTPVLFVHGLWLLSSSWQPWREFFEANGFTAVAPGWPDDPSTVAEAREHPETFAKKMVQQVTDHYLEIAVLLDQAPVVIGHSFGGLIAQKLAGEGGAALTVSIDGAPFKGVLPLPASSLRSAAPVLSNPANVGRSVSLTFDQFRYGWANALEEDEAKHLYETYHVPAAGAPLFQAAVANFNPFGGETTVDSRNPERGPMLIIGGEQDHTVPPAITNASYRIQSRNPGTTEEILIPNRGHSLTIDSGWRVVAETALAFTRRFIQ
jgi:pimeloyl-ACP methyl ester carboxylesterase